MQQHAIAVALVEDDPFWTEALSQELSADPGLDLSFVASSLEEALALLGGTEVDVVLVDIHLRSAGADIPDGLALTRLLTARTGGRAKVIVLTADTSPDIIVQSFQRGAVNFVAKSHYRDIGRAVREAHAGEPGIHPDAAAALRHELQLSVLTPSEREVYERKRRGLRNAEIARLMHVSVHTVKWHWQRVRQKLFG